MTISFTHRTIASLVLAALVSMAMVPGAGAQTPDRAAMETRRYLSLARDFIGECDNAAWSLWWSNDYEKWRKTRRGMLSINYRSRAMEKTPPAPKSLDPALARPFEEQVAWADRHVFLKRQRKQ